MAQLNVCRYGPIKCMQIWPNANMAQLIVCNYGPIKCMQSVWRVTPDTLHTFNWAIILQYFTVLNYELFCKHNGILLGAHFIYLNSGSLLGLKMAKKKPKHVALLTTKYCHFL